MKRLFPFSLTAVLILTIVLSGCGRKTETKEDVYPETKEDVYVAGFVPSEFNEFNNIAAYWKNGTLVKLTDGTESSAVATAITVAGSHVYVAGNEVVSGDTGSLSYVKYWVDGESETLATNGNASSIFVISGDVYVAGGKDKYAMYWKNGTPVPLTDGTQDAYAHSITVYGGKVYVTGYEYHEAEKIAKYWVDDGEQVIGYELTDGAQNAEAYALAISSDDSIHVVGNEYMVAMHWINGDPVPLTDGTKNARAKSIYAAGSDIYIAGYDWDSAKYWKNGSGVELTDGEYDAEAWSILVYQGNTYVTGHQYNGTNDAFRYWKNGLEVQQVDGTQTDSGRVYGAFIHIH